MGITETKKKIFKELPIKKCEECGYCKYPEILTLHHVFPIGLFPKQPKLPRELKYKILCPNCHALVNLGTIKYDLDKIRREHWDAFNYKEERDYWKVACENLRNGGGLE